MAIILCALPFGTLTASAETSGTTMLNGATLYYSIENGEVTITDCDTSISGDVTIPSTLGGYPVTAIGDSAFYGCNLLTSVTIPDSITNIYSYAFFNCNTLKKVNIIDLSAWCNIDFEDEYSNPLYYAKNLYINESLATDIIISGSAIKIKDYAFYHCESLTSVTMDKGITAIDYLAFSNCDSLTSITIPDSVESIGMNAFQYCYSLTKVNITDIAAWCNINFYSYASNPLYYACNLYINGNPATDIVIPDSVTAIKYAAFYNCDLLTSITISNHTTSIGDYAFHDCNSLISAIIPESVRSIGNSTFSYCSSLTTLSIPDSVTSIGDLAFSGCESLKSINVDLDNSFYSSLDGVLFNKNKSELITYPAKKMQTSYTIPSSVTKIGNSAFLYASLLISITIPKGVTSIGDGAFHLCESLTSITIPNTVTRIGNYPFSQCYSLREITLPNSVEYIGWSAFNCCDSFETVYYIGTEDQWNKINISSSNENLLNANIIFLACYCGKNDLSDWKTIVEATCTNEGEKERSCNNCGEKQTEIIPMLSHNLINGECSMCETTIIESEHNYANRTDKTWTVTKENAIKMTIIFSADTFTETNYDFIYIYDKNNNQIGKYTGSQLASQTIIVVGNTVNINLTSDGSSTRYGFKAEITPIYPEVSVEGDLDGDGKVTSADVKIIKDIVLGDVEISEEEQVAYDVNGDGAFDMLDYIYIKKLYQEVLDAKSDINGDEKLDSADVVLMKKAVLDTTELTAEDIEAYDLNGDNKLDILDLIRIKKLLANV